MSLKLVEEETRKNSNMFVDLKEWMEHSTEKRKEHLNLDDKCVEIGGDSRIFRGILAHHLGTTMEGLGMRTGYCCHACGNAKCSNPKHLYWGTASENVLDMKEHGTYESIWDRRVAKYGLEEVKKQLSEDGKKGGQASGGHNKLSKEVIKKRIDDYNKCDFVWGRNEHLAKKWGVSHTQVTRFLRKYL